jgi:hypothetical protein
VSSKRASLAHAGAVLSLAVAVTGMARAQDAPAVPGALSAERLLAAAVHKPADSPLSGASRFTPPPDGLSADTARTSVDRRIGEGLTGSLGYLCGIDNYSHDALQPRGPASSYGRESTFLGAKLSYAFH